MIEVHNPDARVKTLRALSPSNTPAIREEAVVVRECLTLCARHGLQDNSTRLLAMVKSALDQAAGCSAVGLFRACMMHLDTAVALAHEAGWIHVDGSMTASKPVNLAALAARVEQLGEGRDITVDLHDGRGARAIGDQVQYLASAVRQLDEKVAEQARYIDEACDTVTMSLRSYVDAQVEARHAPDAGKAKGKKGAGDEG